jgi:hypothetical protein
MDRAGRWRYGNSICSGSAMSALAAAIVPSEIGAGSDARAV